jgi:hypothetical protein
MCPINVHVDIDAQLSVADVREFRFSTPWLEAATRKQLFETEQIRLSIEHVEMEKVSAQSCPLRFPPNSLHAVGPLTTRVLHTNFAHPTPVYGAQSGTCAAADGC